MAPRGGRTLKNGTVAPRSPHLLRAASAGKPHGLRRITVWRLRGCGDCTATPRILHYFRTISAQPLYIRIYPGLPPRARTRYRSMLVDNVNTYAVEQSHLRHPTKRTGNRRQIYRPAPGAKCELSITVSVEMVGFYHDCLSNLFTVLDISGSKDHAFYYCIDL